MRHGGRRRRQPRRTGEPFGQRPEPPHRVAAAPARAAAAGAAASRWNWCCRRRCAKPGTPTRHVYFPTQGFMSLVAAERGPSRGWRSAWSAARACSARNWRWAWRPRRCARWCKARARPGASAAAPFRAELARSTALQRVLNRYVYVLMAQLAAVGRLPALPPDRPAPGALAADEPGPRAVRPLPRDARVPGLHARRAPRRHHRRGRRAAAQRTHRIPPRRPEGARPGRPGSRSVQLLRQRIAAPTANCWADASRAPTAPRPHPDPQGSRPFVHHKSLRRLGLVSVLRQPRRTACPRRR